MISSFVLISRIIRYNLKIIFAGRFFLFLLAAFAFYVFFMVVSVFDNTELNIAFLYEITFFPALLLIFYTVPYFTLRMQNQWTVTCFLRNQKLQPQ